MRFMRLHAHLACTPDNWTVVVHEYVTLIATNTKQLQ